MHEKKRVWKINREKESVILRRGLRFRETCSDCFRMAMWNVM